MSDTDTDKTVPDGKYKVGTNDPDGRPIERVYWSTQKFVIYEAADPPEGGDASPAKKKRSHLVRYILPADYDTAKGMRANISGLLNLRSAVELLRSHRHTNTTERVWSGRELANTLGAAFEGSSDQATLAQTLITTQEELSNRIKSHLRKRYVLSSLVAFLVITLLLVLLILLLGSSAGAQTNLFPLKPDRIAEIKLNWLGHYSAYCIFGAMGALFSITIGVMSIDVDVDLGGWQDYFSGGSRVFIGIFAAIILALAVQSQFINPNWIPDPSTGAVSPGLLFLSFVAGFSETIVPNLMRRSEDSIANNGKNAPAPEPKPDDQRGGQGEGRVG